MKIRSKTFFIILLLLVSCDRLFNKKTGVSALFELEISSPQADASTLEKAKHILIARLETFGFTTQDIELNGHPGFMKLVIHNFDSIKTPIAHVRKLLTAQGNLEFWETYANEELISQLVKADSCLSHILFAPEEKKANTTRGTSVADTTSLINRLLPEDSIVLAKAKREHPLFFVLQPFIDQQGKAIPGPVVGRTLIKDTAKVMAYLGNEQIKRVLPDNVKFTWAYKRVKGTESVAQLLALKSTRINKKAALCGDIITDARKEYYQENQSRPGISITMTDSASQAWAMLTENNIGNSIAIVLDNEVFSYPTVQSKINRGQSRITGDFTDQEADDLVNIFNAGNMPVKIKIMEERFYLEPENK